MLCDKTEKDQQLEQAPGAQVSGPGWKQFILPAGNPSFPMLSQGSYYTWHQYIIVNMPDLHGFYGVSIFTPRFSIPNIVTHLTTLAKNFKDSNFGPSLNANYTGAIGTTLDFPNDLDPELCQLQNYRPKILKIQILSLH